MFNDKLFEFFEQRLYSMDFEPETQEEFIYRVVEDYVSDLIQVAHIPIKYLQGLQADLEEEVFEMLKKKTYGFASIREFRDSLLDENAQ